MGRNEGSRRLWAATALVSVLAVVLTATAAEAAGEHSVLVPSPSAVVPVIARPAVDRAEATAPAARTHALPVRRTQAAPQTLVRLSHDLVAHTRPWASAPVAGTVTAFSKYYRVPIVAWIEQVSRDGRWGLLQLPYVSPRQEGWIPIGGLRRTTTRISVHIDLSERRIMLYRGATRVYGAPAAIGTSASPTPPGRYFVTDRVAFWVGHYLGSFAFGISGIQPHLPAGWSGGDQLAIHGTNDPSSIGQARSAGCLRVSETTLARLKPLLRLGTPVIVVP